MKIKSLFFVVLSVVFLASCAKESTLPTPELSSTEETVTVKTYTNSPAFSLNWDFTGGDAEIVKTYIQFSSDKEFISSHVASASGNSYLVTYRDIQKMNAIFGETSDFVLYVRLLIEGEDVQSRYSNKLAINIDLP